MVFLVTGENIIVRRILPNLDSLGYIFVVDSMMMIMCNDLMCT